MDEFSDVYKINDFYDQLRERTFKSKDKAIEFMERNLYKVLLYDKEFKMWVLNDDEPNNDEVVVSTRKLKANAYVKYKEENGKTKFTKLHQFLLGKDMEGVLTLYEDSEED